MSMYVNCMILPENSNTFVEGTKALYTFGGLQTRHTAAHP